MSLKCVLCSIKSQDGSNIKNADFVLNGQSVCVDHAQDVAAGPGSSAVVIGWERKP